jgi:hypothetical protein
MKCFDHFKQNKIELTTLKNAIRCKKSPRKFIGLPTINISTDSFFFNFLSPPKKINATSLTCRYGYGRTKKIQGTVSWLPSLSVTA